MRAFVGLLLVTGCFDPKPQAGSPCPDGHCPSGLVCSPATMTCERDATPVVDADLPTTDSAIDSPPMQLVPCLRDDFNDGNSNGWMITEGTFGTSSGPDGSLAVAAVGTQSSAITHPQIHGITAARVTVDFRIDNASTGDFFVRLYGAGWMADPATGRRYSAAMYPMGSDDPNDRFTVTLPPAAPVQLVSRPTTTTVATWHRLVVIYAADRSMRMELDGQPYLSQPSDSQIPPPLDIAFRFWSVGAIDNVAVDCAR